MNTKGHTDWLGLIAVILFLIGGALFVGYNLETKIAKCTSDPLKYAIDKAEISYNYSYIDIKAYLDYEGQIVIYDKRIVNPNKPIVEILTIPAQQLTPVFIP